VCNRRQWRRFSRKCHMARSSRKQLSPGIAANSSRKEPDQSMPFRLFGFRGRTAFAICFRKASELGNRKRFGELIPGSTPPVKCWTIAPL